MSQGKVLVTGGMGYIGSHTAVELIAEGYEVVIFDNLINSKELILDCVNKITGITPTFENVDLCDYLALEKAYAKHGNFDSVIHFAALKAVGESVEKPLLYYENNIQSLINLLKLMSQHKTPSVVFSSSCTVYGQPDVLPVTEAAEFKPALSPYGATKQLCEGILKDTANLNEGLNTVALRYFNPIGAHESAELGELPQGVPNNLLPYLTQVAVGVREKLSVFGSDYDTPDGTCIRDYIHVVDLAKAHVSAVKRLQDGANESAYEFFNLGTGVGTSVLEVINAFESANQMKVNYEIVERRSGDVARSFADTSMAEIKLGWKAERSVEDMVASSWAWEQNFRNNIEPKIGESS